MKPSANVALFKESSTCRLKRNLWSNRTPESCLNEFPLEKEIFLHFFRFDFIKFSEDELTKLFKSAIPRKPSVGYAGI